MNSVLQSLAKKAATVPLGTALASYKGSMSGAEFSQIMHNVMREYPKDGRIPRKFGVAVSGGTDSMALLSLMAEKYGAENIYAFSVDHHLRQESSMEVMKVAEFAKSLGCHHEILNLSWTEGEISSPSKLQTVCREKRYDMLLEACYRNRVPCLMTAHNLEDDFVTMLYRVSRSSGVDGVAGIQYLTYRRVVGETTETIDLLRPLLSVPKERLVKTLEERGIQWMEDPSNHQLNFARNELRDAVIRLQSANPDITTDRLVNVMNTLKKLSLRIRKATAEVIKKSSVIDERRNDFTLVFKKNEDWINNDLIMKRIMTYALSYVSCESLSMSENKITKLVEDIRESYVDFCSQDRSPTKHWSSLPPDEDSESPNEIITRRGEISLIRSTKKAFKNTTLSKTLVSSAWGRNLGYRLSSAPDVFPEYATRNSGSNNGKFEPLPMAIVFSPEKPKKADLGLFNCNLDCAPKVPQVWGYSYSIIYTVDKTSLLDLSKMPDRFRAEQLTSRMLYEIIDSIPKTNHSVRGRLINFALCHRPTALQAYPVIIDTKNPKYYCLPHMLETSKVANAEGGFDYITKSAETFAHPSGIHFKAFHRGSHIVSEKMRIPSYMC